MKYKSPYDVGLRNFPVVEHSDREVANLLAVKDHYLKLVVTLEDFLLNRLYSSALPSLR